MEKFNRGPSDDEVKKANELKISLMKNNNFESFQKNLLESLKSLKYGHNFIKPNRQTKKIENGVINNTIRLPIGEEIASYLQNNVKAYDENRFLFIETLGSGGFGHVYRAYDKKNMKFLAIKDILMGNKEKQEQDLKEILYEQYIMRSIENIKSKSNIFLKYHSLYQRKIKNLTIYSLVMENGICDWYTISKYRKKKHDEYKEEEYCYILYKICEQLHKLEKHGISQRDIKPQNIVIAYDENKKNFYKIIDFGSGYKTSKPKQKSIAMNTLSGISHYYAAPEVQNNELKFYDPYKADVYSLGITFLEVMASEIAGREEKIKLVNQKFKNLGPIIRSMVQNNFISRPQFSEIKNILKNFQKSEPNESVYLQKIEQKLKMKDTDFNSLLLKISLFSNFDKNICYEYCQIALQTIQNEDIDKNSKLGGLFFISASFLLGSEFNQLPLCLKMMRKLLPKKKEKFNDSTILYILLKMYTHFFLRNTRKFEKYFDQLFMSKSSSSQLQVLFLPFLDLILDYYLSTNSEQTREFSVKAIEIKKKLFQSHKLSKALNIDQLCLLNYLALADDYYNKNFKVDTDLLKKIKEIIQNTRNSEVYYFQIYSGLYIYYKLLFFHFTQENDFNQISALHEEIQNDITRCAQIFGKEHKFAKCLVLVKEANTLRSNVFEYISNIFSMYLDLKNQSNSSELNLALERIANTKLNPIIKVITIQCFLCRKTIEEHSFIKLRCFHKFCMLCLHKSIIQQSKEFSGKEISFFKYIYTLKKNAKALFLIIYYGKFQKFLLFSI